ncbi:hypothetical protein LN042_01305 [Kitasatospora sp. RB6PN24]|uniref:low affinity iron permease family protein n=1 Tax=Kitasatospora humi TaxID=2893891 RepID=UPI001E5923D9|nr:low affinity iron permease family protein [Kitasatospora humi]MCC9305756.1 hypothetical protein [Kitasatospora humi]
MTVRHPAERSRHGRGPFEHLAEAASNFTGSPLFYLICTLLVAAFVIVHALGLPLSAQLAAGDAMTAVTLLLIALLKNSERRAEHAIQRKLDAIASAVLEQLQGEKRQAEEDLEQAIGLEEKT